MGQIYLQQLEGITEDDMEKNTFFQLFQGAVIYF